MADEDDDPFAVFGSDSESDDNEPLSEAQKIANFVTQQCALRRLAPHHCRVELRRVKEEEDSNNAWEAAFQGFSLQPSEWYDVCIMDCFEPNTSLPAKQLVPNGLLIVAHTPSPQHDDDNTTHPLRRIPGTQWTVRTTPKITIDVHSCPWHKARPTRREYELVSVLCVSAHEQEQHLLMEYTKQRAVTLLRDTGYCVIRNLLDKTQSVQYGQAVLQDLELAADMLQKEHNVHLKEAGGGSSNNGNDYPTFRELSMREDLRMDIRDGPYLRKLRGPLGNQPRRYTAQSTTRTDFLRGHPDILEIVQRVMNPVDTELSVGNYGRYNFDGSGPDGTHQDLAVGVVGGIVSLPGSADQAVHADTPHLFEHLRQPLPAHYINVFTPGCPSTNGVGQTAFVHGSHSLEFVARHTNPRTGTLEASVWEHLVRPKLDLGDVVLFDCRLLHFGLANTHPSVERPLLYANFTMHWFQDPKNWNQHRSIFSEQQLNGRSDNDDDA